MSYLNIKEYLSDKLLTQYNGTNICDLNNKLLDYTYDIINVLKDIKDSESLDQEGSYVGFGRYHCNCYYVGDVTCCKDNDYVPMTIDYEFTDDELYKRFVEAKAYADRSLGSLKETIESVKILYDCDATMYYSRAGKFNIVIDRPFTEEERRLFPLARRILLRYPTIYLEFSYVAEGVEFKNIDDSAVEGCELYLPQICYGL